MLLAVPAVLFAVAFLRFKYYTTLSIHGQYGVRCRAGSADGPISNLYLGMVLLGFSYQCSARACAGNCPPARCCALAAAQYFCDYSVSCFGPFAICSATPPHTEDAKVHCYIHAGSRSPATRDAHERPGVCALLRPFYVRLREAFGFVATSPSPLLHLCAGLGCSTSAFSTVLPMFCSVWSEPQDQRHFLTFLMFLTATLHVSTIIIEFLRHIAALLQLSHYCQVSNFIPQYLDVRAGARIH